MVAALRALSVGLFAIVASVSAASSRLPDGRPNGNIRPIPAMPKIADERSGAITDRKGNVLPPTNTVYYFKQLIDHNDPSKGTFSQRYWHTWEFYKPGGCIVLSTPGEANADGYDGYLTNRTINGQIAQQEGCATVVIEHRYYGYSNPFPDLSVKSLRYHTIEQAIADLDYFAKNVVLPMPGGDNVKPSTNPWVLVGGSYSGALTSFVKVATDSFWIGYSSSGVVQSITQFWGYFEPIRQGMPKNCSADVQRVIEYVDKTFTNGTKAQQAALKANWGLGAVEHLDDVAGALRNNLWAWQSLSPTSGGGSFYSFCNALEVKNGVSAPADGWGLDNALKAWGKYWNTTYYASICGSLNANDCLGTYDPTQAFWTDTSLDQSYRSWTWIVCNEVGFFQDGAPLGWPTLVSRLIPPPYDIRQCSYYFPEAYKAGSYAPNVESTNTKYKGWDVREPRLFFANGRNDPWREATVSADNSTYPNTTTYPVGLSANGFHCSDLSTRSAAVDSGILALQQQALRSVKSWIAEFKPTKGKREAKVVSTGRIGLAGATGKDKAVQPVLISKRGKWLKPINLWVKGAPVEN